MTAAAESAGELSHWDRSGQARMVNIRGKPVSRRVAVAEGWVECKTTTLAALRERALPKGDGLAVARIAAIQAAKRTPEWIPLCHPIPLDWVQVDFGFDEDRIRVLVEVRATARTGVEMEALTAVAAAALTLYDMCKAVDAGMKLSSIRLVSKGKEPDADP